MAGLLKNVTNSIWHAFMALHQEPQGMVNKSKLKVLTANIASLFDLYGVEKGLEHFRSTPSLTFEHFKYYLMQEVFSSLSPNATLTDLRGYESKIEEICWLVCRRKYQTPPDYPVSEEFRYKLFRIFCMLSDLIINEDNNINEQCEEVRLHPSEAAQILQQSILAMGLDCDTDKTYNNLLESSIALNFQEFLNLFEFTENKSAVVTNSDSKESIHEVIDELYQTYINDIIKKGHLLRKGYLLPTLKEYWFVLQPCELNYYKNTNQKELCGSIHLDPFCMVRPCSIPGKTVKQLKFALSTGDRHFELAAPDHRSRLQWIAALQLAITYSLGKVGYQRDLAMRRRKRREIEFKRKHDEELIRSLHRKEAETAKTQLEQEKLARMAAETQTRQLQIVAREDSRRVAELEDVKINLEKLLSEEMQAKRDEEIVRALQARVLAEEWEKRDELEQLQEEQRIILEQEREKRRQFEIIQKEKEQHLRDTEVKLKELEIERQRLDLELKQARFKIIHSEENKEALEARLQLLCPDENNSGGGGGVGIRGGNKNGGNDRIRRALSFMHSSRERPVGLDIRSTTLLVNRSQTKSTSTKSPIIVKTTATKN